MVYFTSITFLSLFSSALAHYGHVYGHGYGYGHNYGSGTGTGTGVVTGTGTAGPFPPYPTHSAPYPIYNSTAPLGPTGTNPITTSYTDSPVTPSSTGCPTPVTVTVTEPTTVTETVTVTTSSVGPYPTGTGGTAAPTGTAAPSYGYYPRRALEMRGLQYREELKEKRGSWFSWL